MRFIFFLLFKITLLLGSLSANEKKIKNVLFLISDDLKASVLGCYGNKICKTVNIDRLAEESLVFDRAYCKAHGAAHQELRSCIVFIKGALILILVNYLEIIHIIQQE